ncbi:MAG: alanine racemase [Phycisphaerales bacterium]
MTFTSRIEVDLAAVERNVAVVRRAIGASTNLCAVLKADGYGLGAVRLAKRLAIAGLEMIAVYTPDQARALVDASLPGNLPILILMPVRELERSDPLYRAVITGQVHLTIHDAETLTAIADFAQALGVTIPVHVEVDTGMSRGGASVGDSVALIARAAEHPRLRLVGVFTHCAASDSSAAQTRAQAEAFDSVLRAAANCIPQDCLIHQASTHGCFRSRTLHRRMVRVGLALLGYGGEEFADPENVELLALSNELTPVVRWVSKIVQTKWIQPGTPVGYGCTWRAKRRTRLGLVPVGYADGYPRMLSNKARVGVELANGLKAFVPQVGTVSMDQITVDLTDLPEQGLGAGSWVEIVGNDRSSPNHLPTLAKEAGTITHELLCRFGPRVPRHYIAMEETKPDTGNAGAMFRVAQVA